MAGRTPKLAVWKFTSCDGCQLSLLDLEDELLAIASRLTIAYFKEATRAEVKGPYDLSLVEGSVSTPEQLRQVQQVRKASRLLVTIGTCATSGGIQALRNFADVGAYLRLVYPSPEYLETLETSTPISDHVPVDLELQGCPISKRQLLAVVSAYLNGGRLHLPASSVCMECKRRGNVCVLVARGTPCLGPVTRSGCGALCPTYHRGCYGCFGPKETPNTQSLSAWFQARLALPASDQVRLFRQFYANAEAFRAESLRLEKQKPVTGEQ
uniref:Oxidoreductase n=1 Tax=Desulfobacca acetoxidans TaxID=60893 RepID=A0A7V6A1P0_9BACT